MTLTLEERAIASSSDREPWLRARRAGVTATEMAKLERGGAAFATILREKRTGLTSFNGNKYTDWGKLREPEIAKWVESNFDIAPSDVLYHALGNPQHLATPDGVGSELDGSLVLSEIKTGKHDYSTPPREYLVQMWWAQYVLDAQRTLYAFERHDDNWPEPEPLYEQPEFKWIERDDLEIARLITIADEFLAELAKEVDTDPEYDLELDELAQSVLIHRELETAEKKAKEAAWKILLAKSAEKKSVAQESGVARVTYSTTSTPTIEPDEDAARAADPDLFERYDALSKELAEHKAKFTKPGTSTKTTLTVTAVKKEKTNA